MTPLRAAFLLGAALSLVLVFRSQIGGDQWNLLARGWLLVAHGTWTPYGNPTSAGGNEIGSFTTWLMALPLWLWRNHHAPTLLVWLCHLGAYALLDDVVRRTTGPRERLLFAVLYWLNPWRMYYSGHLWNPNFLFLAGAVHLWTADRQRAQARWFASFTHVMAIGLACQLHPSAIILALASAALVWTRGMRIHVAGTVLGLAIVAASLVPWMIAAARTPAILPIGGGFVGRGILTVVPLARGLLDWVRYGSLYLGGTTPFDFSALVGAGVDRWLAPVVQLIVRCIGVVTFVPVALANVWFWRRLWRRRRARHLDRASGRHWLAGYVATVFAAAVVAFSLAPTTVMFWQGFVLLHAAVLPPVLWLGVLSRSRLAPSIRAGVGALAGSSVALVLLMAAGSPHYRCGGEGGVTIALDRDYAMIDDLHARETCAVPVDAAHGWAPDIFREPR